MCRNVATAENTVRMYFARNRSGNFWSWGREHSSRPAVMDDILIETIIKNDTEHRTSQRYFTYLIIVVFENTWVRELLRYLGASRKEINGPHFHLRYSAQAVRKTNFFWKGRSQAIKMDCLQQYARKNSSRKWNEPPLTPPKAGLHPNKVMWYLLVL